MGDVFISHLLKMQTEYVDYSSTIAIKKHICIENKNRLNFYLQIFSLIIKEILTVKKKSLEVIF